MEEEFEKEYNAHIEELRSRGFTDSFLEMEKTSKWLPKIWFVKGYKNSQKEMQEKLDEAIEVIRFYAKIEVWGVDTPHMMTSIDPCDQEQLGKCGVRGGKRARDFLKARGE